MECFLPSTPIKVTVDSPSPAHTLNDHTTNVLSGDSPSIRLLSTMSWDDVVRLVHHKGSVLPLVHPCDTANSCNKKTHWTAKDLHCAMGCCKFCNYKHLLQVSQDGIWVDCGEFPWSVDSFVPVPKSSWGKPFERTWYKYLDAVHVDIAFGDCL
jgi:hypothetical protein